VQWTWRPWSHLLGVVWWARWVAVFELDIA
jgi:hypothetical protein